MSPKYIDSCTMSGNKIIVVIKCGADEGYKKTVTLTAHQLAKLIKEGLLENV